MNDKKVQYKVYLTQDIKGKVDIFCKKHNIGHTAIISLLIEKYLNSLDTVLSRVEMG